MAKTKNRPFVVGDQVIRKGYPETLGVIVGLELSSVGLKAARIVFTALTGKVVKLYHTSDIARRG